MKVYEVNGLGFENELWISKHKAMIEIAEKYPIMLYINGHIDSASGGDFASADDAVLTVKAILDRDGFFWITKSKRTAKEYGTVTFSTVHDVKVTMKTVNGTP